MAKLTFTYDMGYVSSAFEGGMTLQCLFDGNGKHVIFIQSRLSEELPWTVIRSIVVAPQSVFTIPEAAEGQTFRIRCESEPQSVDIAPMTAVAGGSSTTIDGIDIDEFCIGLDGRRIRLDGVGIRFDEPGIRPDGSSVAVENACMRCDVLSIRPDIGRIEVDVFTVRIDCVINDFEMRGRILRQVNDIHVDPVGPLFDLAETLVSVFPVFFDLACNLVCPHID